jgi:23S rRNA (guanosine2251-2'-O)-methyltransferase
MHRSDLSNFLYAAGRRSALELLRDETGRSRIEKVYIEFGLRQGPQFNEILHLIRTYKVPHSELDKHKFRSLQQRESPDTDAQGILILLKSVADRTLDDILGEGRLSQTSPLLIALDGITDPHNIGAIIRSAEAFGADAVLIAKHGAALTPAVFKSSAGAAHHLPIVKYTNLPETIFRLREEFFIKCIGLAGEANETLADIDLVEPVCFIVGSEEKGLHHLVRKRCDVLVKIPLAGKTASLNAGVASAIALYEASRSRLASE